ncbi:helix-turn-helix domain-containing protein [Microbacterium sp. AR7-10]|uniref:MerR family transcriptional regulator n=1 Tax=Microbacterium sp. AR7-10 TaxID=1891970 RepID=UPI0008FC3904|nr:helix-turn-helix domain-containing protein [Microbacterium sp. AR7-10]
MTERKKLTTGQVAERFGVNRYTVQKWADEGKLPCTRTLGGDRRFDAAEIEKRLALS